MMTNLRHKRPLVAVIAASALLVGCQQEGGIERATDAPQTDIQKESYAVGRNFGLNVAQVKTEIELDSAYFNAGLFDAVEGEQRMTDEEVAQTLQALQQKAVAQQQEKMQQEAATNLAAAEEFLAANAAKDGVVSLDSGLQYRVVTPADGNKPSAEDTVTVHYEGRLIDGTVFDSSYSRGEPATFPLSGVIAGWTEALQLMAPGAKYELFIPPSLGYGAQSRQGSPIKANSLLIFDVELIAIAGDGSADGE